ncbi:putative quinol monooxygenase [Angustibacter luteus]|uniref:Quinol monooxygenase n=1 Tax=Angustibacter luteus TaxID=658456 RepID=A0ABW1JCE3_9ACTN
MPDIPVVAVIVANPGSEDVVRAALADLVEPTRAEEGCRSYELHESAAAPGTFVTIESWSDASDLDKHLATPHVAAALAAADGHLALAPGIHPLTVVPR